MSLTVKIVLAAALILSIAVPFGAFAAGEKTRGRYKTALGRQRTALFRHADNRIRPHVLRPGLCRR